MLEIIKCLNNDKNTNGILVQLPLPNHIDEHKVIQAIAPEKDVDGFHVSNLGKLVIGADTFIPCTTKGIIELLIKNNIEIDGANCVVVGRSNIVGKPTAIELLRHNATVTVCHSKTKELKQICKNADILVCAIGKPRFFNKEYVKEGAVVVDVGIHRTENGLCGDVDFDDVKDVVSGDRYAIFAYTFYYSNQDLHHNQFDKNQLSQKQELREHHILKLTYSRKVYVTIP